MSLSNSSQRLKELIEKSIEDHLITRKEYDAILAIANEDGHIDKQEQALLNQLQEMIEFKEIKIIP